MGHKFSVARVDYEIFNLKISSELQGEMQRVYTAYVTRNGV